MQRRLMKALEDLSAQCGHIVPGLAIDSIASHHVVPGLAIDGIASHHVVPGLAIDGIASHHVVPGLAIDGIAIRPHRGWTRLRYDQTVRSSTGGIVQFMYGDDGLDPTDMEARPAPTYRGGHTGYRVIRGTMW